jgi:glyoxylase-like metal-dependent hydrolase (beta-lactamase superfamily II)
MALEQPGQFQPSIDTAAPLGPRGIANAEARIYPLPSADASADSCFPLNGTFNHSFTAASHLATWSMGLKAPRNYETFQASRGLRIIDGYTSLTLLDISGDTVEAEDREYLLMDSGKDTEVRQLDAALSGVRLGRKAIKAVILTHAHADHTGGLHALGSGIPVFTSANEVPVIQGVKDSMGPLPGLADRSKKHRHAAVPGANIEVIKDEEPLIFGQLTVRALAMPGHTDGSLAFAIGYGSNRMKDLYIGDGGDFNWLGGIRHAARIFTANVEQSERSIVDVTRRLDRSSATIDVVIPTHSASGDFSAMQAYALKHGNNRRHHRMRRQAA